MKELSIEEKAKAYDEAIERSKNYYSTTDSASDIKLIGLIFPELKESEDERMVKFIKKQLFNIKKTITENYELDAKLTKAIAWLEKQGNLMKALQISNAEIGELIEKNYYLKEQLEKQSEQKPTDKIKPKFKVGDIVKHKDNPHLTYILKRFTDDGDYEFHAIGKDGNEGCTCFSVVKYQDEWELVEQKPTVEMKTSEESLGIDSDTYNKIVDECIYGEQKPTWSEEDEKILNYLLWFYDTRFRWNDTCGDDIKFGDIVTFLKSLKDRYTWKPSDEQIKVCKEVYADILSAKGFDLGTVNSELNRLEEQLKKQKE